MTTPLHSQLDVIWTLLCGMLVFMMQAGFMCLESGFVRQKNTINVAIKNVTDFLISSVAFFIVGFALMFGKGYHGLIGTDGFFLTNYITRDKDCWIYTFWFFQVVFCGVAATIVSGGVAERMRFSGYMWISLIISVFIYPIFGHWAWGGAYDLAPEKGWLAAMGYRDFAGSSVVHMVGGTCTLAALLVLGPRKGRYHPNGSTNTIYGCNLPMSALGLFLLWVGWFGFNAGSTMAVNNKIAMIIINTNLAACTGSLAYLFITWFRTGKPHVESIINGALGGLVAITASCAYVTPLSSLFIGLLGGLAVNVVTRLLDRFQIDDAVGAVPVHLGAGMVGILCVGIFVQEPYLINGSRIQQLGVQTLGMVTCFVFVFSVAWFAIKIIDRYVTRLRVASEEETQGLNLSEHGARTLWMDLTEDILRINKSDDLTLRATIEMETTEGIVAEEFNRLMGNLEAKEKALSSANAKLLMLNRELMEKNEENEAFVYSTSHDLRSPLINITGFSNEIARAKTSMASIITDVALSSSEKEKKLMQIEAGIEESLMFIDKATSRMNTLIEGILKLSRAGKVEYELNENALSVIVQNIIDAMKAIITEKRVHVTVQPLPIVYGDRAAIEQIFANLIGNALNYLDPTRPGTIEVGQINHDEQHETIYVKDNGLGIPAIAQANLFQLFQRFAPDWAVGEGIGLAIVRKAVARHGGKIWVDSQEGVGSTFFVQLPKGP